MAVLPEGEPLAQVRAYHQRTKHAPGAYAKGPGQIDWITQPDPFRRYEGAPVRELPLAADHYVLPYAWLFKPGTPPASPAKLSAIAALLELAFGLSAWKGYGEDRWPLRCNPSSGNLHPTEAYVVAGEGVALPPGVHHYVSHDHALEHRCQAALPFRGLLVGFSSIHWREAWKYGERAFRYCQHDLGHALAALRYAAGVLGWTVTVLDEWSDADIGALLGVDRPQDLGRGEAEAPDLLCRIHCGEPEAPVDIDALVAAARAGEWRGEANRLSRRHLFDWPIIDEVHAATFKPRNAPSLSCLPEPPPLLPTACDLAAAELIKQRRSAQGFDGKTAITAKALFRILDATLPRPDVPPFDAWPWEPRVHLFLFAHRVAGLPPGIYLFCRHPDALDRLRALRRKEFGFDRAENCPPHLDLYRLIRADTRKAARALSCQQAIAADSAFSLGMLAEFDTVLDECGPWGYRRLFWETGMIGQVLYLEAEAAGMRGTGIGCFFDDPVHELLGLEGTEFQSLYHFTIGSPVVDDRLESFPAYEHLRR
jgi:SagB-type dehydrogenase family enzyme